MLEQQEIIYYDSETTGFNPFINVPLCFQFTYKQDEAIVIPLFHLMPDQGKQKFYENIYKTPLKKYWGENQEYVKLRLRQLFESNIKFIGQNMKFDNLFVRTYLKIEVKNCFHDTLLAEHLIEENRPRNLNELTLRYTDYGRYWQELETYKNEHGGAGKKKFSYARIPENILYTYAGYDTIVLQIIHQKQQKELDNQKLNYIFYKIVMPYSRVLESIQYNGALIDREETKNLILKYTEELKILTEKLLQTEEIKRTETLLFEMEKQKITEKWYKLKHRALSLNEYTIKYTHKQVFNFSSPKQLAHAIFDVCKMPQICERSTKKEVLDILSKKYPKSFVAYLATLRMCEKFLNTYLINFEKLSRKDSRIHTTYLQDGTVTGRISSKQPNLQNIPNRDLRAEEIRKCFISPAGWSLIDPDYAQIEFRGWAIMSKDPLMLVDLKSGMDIHYKTASSFYGIPIDRVTKDQRNIIKAVTFGTMYGETERSLAEKYNISQEEAKAILYIVLGRYKIGAKYIEDLKLHAKKFGYVTNYFGRRRHFPELLELQKQLLYVDKYSPEAIQYRQMLRQAVNSPIQGFAHDCLSIAGIRLYSAIQKQQLPMQIILDIHDSLLLHIQDNFIPIGCKIIKKCFEKPIGNIEVPLNVELKIGKRWSELKTVEI